MKYLLIFTSMSLINLIVKSKLFNLMEEQNLPIIGLLLFFVSVVCLIPQIRMVLQRENIATSQKPVLLSCFIPIYLFIFGLSHSPRHVISSAVSHHLFLLARLLMKFYMVKFLLILCFIHLVVFFSHFYVIICPINYHLALFLVFLLDIVIFIRTFVA